MLTVESIGKIRRDHCRDGKSIKAIARARGVSRNTVRKVQRQRETGTVDPLAKGGGWVSPVAWAVLKPLIDAKPDQTCEELTRAYNRVAPHGRVHRSSIWRALQRTRYVCKKTRSRPAEQDRARVQAARAAFRAWAQTIAAERLVCLDESGANLAMGRSHAWWPRGQELIEPRPRNWGDNLSLVGAMRLEGWVTLATAWGAITTPRFVAWVRRHLVRHLRPGDIVVLDNLAAHKAPHVRTLIEAAGATVKFLPPYSYDFNPIEPGWALVKKRIRAVAPRTATLLRGTAQRARRVIQPRHCRSWFGHAGYQVN